MTTAWWLLAPLAVLLLTAQASALPDGRFASPDGTATVELARRADGGMDVAIALPGLEEPLRLGLVSQRGGAILEQPAAPLGWFDRMMGRDPDRLPFEGQRLAWAVVAGNDLIVSSLQVDAKGLPDLRRYALVDDGAGGLTVTPWRYSGMEPILGPVVELEPVGP